VEILGCAPPVLIVVHGCSSEAQCIPLLASPRRYLLETDQVPPSLSFRWCINKESSLESSGVSQDAALLYSLGQALSCCVFVLSVWLPSD
jgi:hypothetical protein